MCVEAGNVKAISLKKIFYICKFLTYNTFSMKVIAKFLFGKYVVFLFCHPTGYFEVCMLDGDIVRVDYLPERSAAIDFFSHKCHMLMQDSLL